MARKKCGRRKINRKTKSKLFAQPKAIENPHTEQLLRCRDWILTHNEPSKNQIDESHTDSSSIELTDHPDNVLPAVKNDSLKQLKYLKRSEIKQNVYFVCEWRNCLENFDRNDEICDHVNQHILQIDPFENKFCCCWDLCSFETVCNEEITRHIHYHAYHTVLKTYGESIIEKIQIPPCTNDSSRRNLIPELKKDFVCYWRYCNYNFKSISLYHQHVQKHCSFEFELKMKENDLKGSRIACGWESCKKLFKCNYRLTEHVRKHTNEKLVGCYHCGIIFSSNTVFFDHCRRQLANNTQEFQCAQCFKYFASERLLRSHDTVHVNCFKCSLCDMTCTSSYSLARHVRYRHLNEKPFKCLQCEKSFVCRSDLRKHSERIHEKKVYECEETGCNYVCKSLFLLKRHDAQTHGDGAIFYACHCCDKMYKNGKDLSKHLIEHHGFQLPSGHKRFSYRLDESGHYRLKTVRIESLEVSKQILSSPVRSDSEIFIKPKVEKRNLILNETISIPIEHEIGSDNFDDKYPNNILIAVNDIDKDGNVIDTKFVNAREINIF